MNGIVMYGRRSPTLVVLAMILAVTFSSSLVQASLLNFDDLDAAQSRIHSQNYAGFQWDTKWVIGTAGMAGFSDVASTGRQFLYNGNSQSNLGIRRLESFDFLGASFATPSAQSKRTFAVRVRAFDENNLEVGNTGYQSVNPEPTWFAVAFENVFRLEIDSYGGVFTMDDFSYQDTLSKLTEAGSLVLLAIGGVGLWAARRRIRHPA